MQDMTTRLIVSLEEEISLLQGEITRLKEGDFTPEEFQNLCHNNYPCSLKEFRQGCRDYQCWLFGAATVSREEEVESVEEEKAQERQGKSLSVPDTTTPAQTPAQGE